MWNCSVYNEPLQVSEDSNNPVYQPMTHNLQLVLINVLIRSILNTKVSQVGVATRGVDPGRLGDPDPLKKCRRGQSMFWPPLKCHILSFKTCCITASFTASRMNSWTLSLHWSCLCWRYYHPYVWSAPSRKCPPINAFAAPLGLKLSWPKTKLQNVDAGDPPSTILIDHGSHSSGDSLGA